MALKFRELPYYRIEQIGPAPTVKYTTILKTAMPFSHKNQSKRPKFLLDLKINELVNIPQSTGYCFVKWHLKDGTGTSSTTRKIPLNSTGNTTTSGSTDSTDKNAVVEVTNQSHGSTPHRLVKHHKVQWNYSLARPLQVKLNVDKNRNLVSKYLKMEVYFQFLNQKSKASTNDKEPKDSNLTTAPTATKKSMGLKSSGENSYSQRITGKILLGCITVDITEYIRKEEPLLTNRFLLQDSKVNSIINISLQLKLIRGIYDDFHIKKTFSMGQLSSSFQDSGISTILDSSNTPSSNSLGASHLSKSQTSYSSKGVGVNMNATISTSMSPLIDKLYERTFQLSWDPRPNEFSPRECVADIMRGGNGWAKNEKGINLIDLQTLKLNELESNSKFNFLVDNGKNENHNKKNSIGSSGNGTSNNDFTHMDRREFLERKKKQLEISNWSHLSPTQRANLRRGPKNESIPNNIAEDDNDDKGIDQNDPEYYSEEDIDKIIKNPKGWSVGQLTF
ncbi:hypothetical protein NCAS_0E02470 [Naumovozyma castellii]|uniref:C2 NT-type domain-containing protein n=1 Tax=Naumovozyma castellii TaxID=27288 RepID=G0VFQ0_NAUCA|nr:hypothetical protein NCAS_0E02470 [Naumovozyma castellii CBS 4309]CCC70317.1 hypothetical protein NCAS_0E02470 [Naumovozyma castellii CBS 4309]